MNKNILITVIISLFFNELKAADCPYGTETDIAGQRNNRGNIANCVNCRANYYFNGSSANFIPGVSQCGRCTYSKTVGAQANPGRIATLALQCDDNCPDGTQTALGKTKYVAQKQECSFCKANYYYETTKDFVFLLGFSRCDVCPVKKASGSQATAGTNASIVKQCDVACPAGTATAYGATSYVQNKNECTYCDANFYYKYTNFNPGYSTCSACPIKKTLDAKHTQGDNAKIDVQCDVACPVGTVTFNGKTTNFENDKSECVKCAANFYTRKQNGWIAGTDICIPCPNILISGAQANYPIFASQAKQCKVVFSQFLSFSLLFIYIYFI
ncbi:immobilization antigen isoform, putative [Ichthyophthirius multifiliis]|uniref:Immobilization antigen isoform, putative n=1 Tax=Ichthyophthirius multifiliis TaxID=5932 RepID=G0QPL0_ICHMU|nr:immobilization antigen isoform, putative [Ichthyophthirius multifiliis]EGR32842.1 immobilization antigen isoform, putative [Ichthyophthirius multifiliis]|eukprot:XP_004036828.1 immobilization antigen isoform, putative [Ichthyophthirius multifiliis]